jgi:hypothetical protein
VLLFANNPVYRGETIGSYPMVFNAIMNFGHSKAPSVPSKEAARPQPTLF